MGNYKAGDKWYPGLRHQYYSVGLLLLEIGLWTPLLSAHLSAEGRNGSRILVSDSGSSWRRMKDLAGQMRSRKAVREQITEKVPFKYESAWNASAEDEWPEVG